jgi:hypothetical protein
VRAEPKNVALGVLLVLLVGVFYPALMLGRRLAPESSLRSVAPWRQEWGPNPEPRARVLAAATQLGPRLEIIARERFGAALWNPWIGGGRPGWLSSAREGGAPLPVLAALLARPGWVWSGLLALTIAVSFSGAWLAARWLGASAWGAAAAAVAYSLAGPVAGYWLDWKASALALGPFALLPALARSTSLRRQVAFWAAVMALLAVSGPPSVPFIAAGLVLELARADARPRRLRAVTLVAALALASLVGLPAAWLAHVGGEAGAAAAAKAPPPVTSVAGLVRSPAPDSPSAPVRQLPSGSLSVMPGSTFIGLSTLLLAAAGFAAGAGGHRRTWGGIIAGAVLLAAAPSGWLEAAGVTYRSMAVLALAAAVLAGLGIDALCRRLPPRTGRAACAVLCTIVLFELAPAALRGLPFAADRDVTLAPPLAQPLPADGSRIVTMASALPPDVAAAFGLADIRAGSYDREPAYEALIRSATSGAVQALDPGLASLGARWVIESSALRLVSGIVFAEVGIVDARRVSAAGAATSRYLLPLPDGTGRIGLPQREPERRSAFLQGGAATVAIEEDDALAEESADWRWFAVPPDAPSGPVVLGVIGGTPAPGPLAVAVDTSGLRLARHGPGVRVWEWTRAQPFARLDGAAGRVVSSMVAPGRVVVDVETPEPATLVVQIKYRPRLWRASVDGAAVETTAADRVWTAVPVGAGRTSVELAAAVPAAVWLPAVLAAIMMALLAIPRRAR